jgi:hypothetical protein
LVRHPCADEMAQAYYCRAHSGPRLLSPGITRGNGMGLFCQHMHPATCTGHTPGPHIVFWAPFSFPTARPATCLHVYIWLSSGFIAWLQLLYFMQRECMYAVDTSYSLLPCSNEYCLEHPIHPYIFHYAQLYCWRRISYYGSSFAGAHLSCAVFVYVAARLSPYATAMMGRIYGDRFRKSR